MNVFFVIGDEVVTPALTGSILPGITRKSSIELLKSWGYKVSERRITIDEVFEAHDKGMLKEVFGTGTAAVISPVGELNLDGKVITINNGEIGPVSKRLYDTITGSNMEEYLINSAGLSKSEQNTRILYLHAGT